MDLLNQGESGYPGYYQPQPSLGHELEQTVSTGLGGFFGCGTSFFTLLLMLVLSCALNVYLLRAFFTFIKDAIITLTALKEAINTKLDDK